MKCDTPLWWILWCTIYFNEIFKTGNWGVTPIGELMMKVVVVVVEYLWKFGELLNFDKMMF